MKYKNRFVLLILFASLFFNFTSSQYVKALDVKQNSFNTSLSLFNSRVEVAGKSFPSSYFQSENILFSANDVNGCFISQGNSIKCFTLSDAQVNNQIYNSPHFLPFVIQGGGRITKISLQTEFGCYIKAASTVLCFKFIYKTKPINFTITSKPEYSIFEIDTVTLPRIYLEGKNFNSLITDKFGGLCAIDGSSLTCVNIYQKFKPFSIPNISSAFINEYNIGLAHKSGKIEYFRYHSIFF